MRTNLLIVLLAFYSQAISAVRAQDTAFQVISWNVESDGSRISTIAGQIRDDFEGIELWGLSEVASDAVAAQFESAAEEGEDVDYGRVTGTTGGRDRLVIFFDQARFDLLESMELDDINVSGTVRAPLVVRLRDRQNQETFLFMVNHLYRGSSAGRHQQATMLNQWAAQQTDPVIAVGDYNFDWHYLSGDQDHDQGYDNMVADGRWEWVRPQILVPTNASGHQSVLDFIFFAASDSSNWDRSSEIIIRTNDFPDDNLKSDHRPVLGSFERLAAPAKPLSAPAMVLRPSRSLERAGKPMVFAPLNVGVAESKRLPDQPEIRPAEAPPGIRSSPEITYKILRCAHPTAPIGEEDMIARNLRVAGNAAPRHVITRSKRWEAGSTVTVAFKGGDKALHKKIANAASEWLAYGNLKFDFGVDANGNYRTWSTSDTSYAARIRISFDQDGYYSLVGTDCTKRSIVATGEESMNFEGFEDDLPPDWAGTVLHEFGHALAFEHEHQHPEGGCDFRWDDDPGYQRTVDRRGAVVKDRSGRKPGVYSVLGGWPNEWSRATVDFNLRQLQNSSAYLTSEFDAESIMKYGFEAWMFVGGSESICASDHDNNVLSEYDQRGMAAAYPLSPDMAAQANQGRLNAIKAIQDAVSSPELKASYEALKDMR